jgi:light-regulated signal transduction histidine kinase (bacteriophytochrome)
MAFAGYPLLLEDRLVGVMALFSQQPFTPAALQTLSWVASVLAMGIDRMYMADALARSIAKTVRMNKHLRQQYAEFDELACLASHDLQEPLRKLITCSGLLQKDLGGHLPERAAKDLVFITDAAARMQALMHNLLELSRLSSATLHGESVALDACIDHALATLAEHPPSAAATITRDALTPVWGDRLMLSQLYVQLLSNALKFGGTQRPLIQCTAERQEGRLILGVKDNGIGIAAEYHDQIFLPFKRLHGRGEYTGTGIGLAICRKIVERHGGCLWVESAPGQGAHFKFTLGHAPR